MVARGGRIGTRVQARSGTCRVHRRLRRGAPRPGAVPRARPARRTRRPAYRGLLRTSGGGPPLALEVAGRRLPGASDGDAGGHDPARRGSAQAVGCPESGKRAPEQLLEPRPDRSCLLAREPDRFGRWADREVERDRLFEVPTDPDREVAAAEGDLAEPGGEQLTTERVGIGLGEGARAAAGLVCLLRLVKEWLHDLLCNVEPGVVEFAPPHDADKAASRFERAP